MKTHTMAAIAVVLVALGSVRGAEESVETVSDPNKATIYGSDPGHLWNRLHRAFFVHPAGDASAQNPDAVDPPLWRNSTFLQSGAGHRVAVAVLDEFLSDEVDVRGVDPVKRAVLQHDLWSVFDWSATCHREEGVPDRNLAGLRTRLADAIRKLALTTEEIATLPNNLEGAAKGEAFGADFDPENPRVPFLPRDLFAPKGSWVCIRGVVNSPSAPVHVRYYKGRSPFLVFIRLPGGRKATVDYLGELNRMTAKVIEHGDVELPLFPVGTSVALIRQMTVIDTDDEIRVTPLTQTLQMRVYRQVGEEVTDHKNSQAPIKFRLRREKLFAGENGGLEPIGWSEPLRVSLMNYDDVYLRDGSLRRKGTVMRSCIDCHSCGGATVHSIFTYRQDDWVLGEHNLAANALRMVATDAPAETERTLRWKQGRSEWGLLKGMLARESEGADVPEPQADPR